MRKRQAKRSWHSNVVLQARVVVRILVSVSRKGSNAQALGSREQGLGLWDLGFTVSWKTQANLTSPNPLEKKASQPTSPALLAKEPKTPPPKKKKKRPVLRTSPSQPRWAPRSARGAPQRLYLGSWGLGFFICLVICSI